MEQNKTSLSLSYIVRSSVFFFCPFIVSYSSLKYSALFLPLVGVCLMPLLRQEKSRIIRVGGLSDPCATSLSRLLSVAVCIRIRVYIPILGHPSPTIPFINCATTYTASCRGPNLPRNSCCSPRA